MRRLLDTNVCVDYLTGRFPQVIARIQRASPEDLCSSSIVVAELRFGAEKSRRSSENHARIDLLVRDLRCFEFDDAAARAYCQVRARLEQDGTPIGPNDMLIAAHVLAIGAVLVTANLGEFGRVEGLTLENWRD